MHTTQAFAGEGQRLNGKVKNGKPGPSQEQEETKRVRGVPNYNYKRGKLTFERAKNLNPHPQEAMVSTVLYTGMQEPAGHGLTAAV